MSSASAAANPETFGTLKVTHSEYQAARKIAYDGFHSKTDSERAHQLVRYFHGAICIRADAEKALEQIRAKAGA